MFRRFLDICAKRHDYARAWKARAAPARDAECDIFSRHDYCQTWNEVMGRRVIGGLCTRVPEAILDAADVLPVRVPDLRWPACRDFLAGGQRGSFDYLDGLVVPAACTRIREALGGVDAPGRAVLTYGMDAPRGDEMDRFKTAVEQWTGKTITDGALKESVAAVDRGLALTRQLDGLRGSDPPPLSGVEALAVALSRQMCDPREHGDLLERALAALPRREPPEGARGTRLLVVGGGDAGLPFYEMVESAGGTIVADDLFPGPGVVDLAEDRACRGAILIEPAPCDPHAPEVRAIRQALQGAGVPLLVVETGGSVPAGELHGRVAAFVEGIGAG